MGSGLASPQDQWTGPLRRPLQLDGSSCRKKPDNFRRTRGILRPEAHKQTPRCAVQVDPNGVALAIDLADLTRVDEMLRPPRSEQCQALGRDVDAMLIEHHGARAHPAIAVL